MVQDSIILGVHFKVSLILGKEHNKDLLKFLKPFPKEVQDTALALREFVWDLYPDTNELIYDNYNALAFGWTPTEKMGHIFSSIAVGRSSYNIHFGFMWGSKLTDPKKILLGEGNQYRYILVKKFEDFPMTYMKKLIKEAYLNSLKMIKPVPAKDKDKKPLRGATITKSISPVKRKVAKRLEKKK